MYLDPTDEQAIRLLQRGIDGPVTMLNLLRFRQVADYSLWPFLAPSDPIAGRAAYERYVAHTTPFLQAAGGEVVYSGDGGHLFIGPVDERWDLVLLVRHASLEAFMGMATNEAVMAGFGHRAAALEDSRLLPMVDLD